MLALSVPISQTARPNLPIKRTSSGSTLKAFISFWALRTLLPRAAHVKR
jgi:hypothetical protein